MHLLSVMFLGSVSLAALRILSTRSSLILPHSNMVVQVGSVVLQRIVACHTKVE